MERRGLHFMAIQEQEESEQWNGIWLLLDQPLPDF